MRRGLRRLDILAAGTLLASALIAWRLSNKPIALPFLTPYLERALSRTDGSLTVRLGGTDVAWDPREGRVGLRVHDARVIGARGETVARVPVVDFNLSGRALLGGRVAVRTARVIGPHLRLTRTAEGAFDLVTDEGGATPGAGGMTAPGFEFRRLEVRDGELVFEDRAAKTLWRLHAADIAMERSAQGVGVVLAGTGELGHATVPIRARGAYRTGAGDVVGTVRFRGLDPAVLATELPTAPARDLLARVHVPLTGGIRAAFDEHLQPRRVRIRAVGGPGRLSVPELPVGELRPQRVGVVAAVDPASGKVSLEKLSLDLGRSRIDVRGSFEGDKFEVNAELPALGVDNLGAHWPDAAAPTARGWITSRVTGGHVRSGAVRVTGEASPEGGITVNALHGSLAFDGVGVRYADGMPPAVGVAGKAAFTSRAWNIHVSSGTVGGLEVKGARVAVADVRGRGRRADVATSLHGPLASALALVRASPAGRGVPMDAGGTVSAHLRLRIPLRPALRTGDIDLLVSARMRDVTVPSVLRGLSFASCELETRLRDGAFDLSGRGLQGGNPVTVAWRERPGDPSSRRVDVSGRLDGRARAALGLDLDRWLDGPVDVRAHLTSGRDTDRVALSADLAPASLDLPMLRTHKPVSSPGSAEASIVLTGGVVTAIERFALRTGGTLLSGGATRAKDGTRWRTLNATARFAPRESGGQPGHVALAVRPAGSVHDFVLTSDDAGSLFRSLGLGSDATGGRLEYAGTVDLAAAGAPFRGHLEVRDFRLLRSTLLARVATLAALSGLTSQLAGKGIPFEELSADIAHGGTTVRIDDGVALGPWLTVLLSGTIERADGTVSLRGTLVPSYYGLNTAPGRIPVVGAWVTGGGREGVQGLDFGVSGPLAAPRVSVDPSSSLAPGVLRDLIRRRRSR